VKRFHGIAAGVLMVAAMAATAQTYPTHPVKIMVGANAGGGTDIIARMLGDKFQSSMGQPFVVENKPGASNTIAADATAKAAPDGHTLLVATNTGQAIAPHLIKLGFDTNKDLVPVALIVVVPNVLVVSPSVPAGNVRDLIAMVKANPDKFAYGSSGVGSTQHLAGEAFNLAAGTKAVHVPYKGSAQALADLVGGQIQLDFDTTSSAMAFIKGGKVKALAVTGLKRHRLLPDVPTFEEAGYKGFDGVQWYGIAGPANLPAPIVKRLNDEINRMLADPELRERLSGEALDPMPMSPEQFVQYMREDIARWSKVAEQRNIHITD